MTRKLLVLFLCLFAAYYAKAALDVSKANGIVTLTLNAPDDLKNAYESLGADIKNATNVVVVTKNGVSMSSDDVKTLCGDWGGNRQLS